MAQILPEKTRETLSLAFELMLSRDMDRSQKINGVGFNKFDSNEIHKDFDGKSDVSDNILIKHAHRLRKYEKQLIDLGFDKNEITKAIDEIYKIRSIASECSEAGGKQAYKGKAGRPKHPEYTKVNPENIPLPLKNERRWTVWKSVDKHDGKKPSKVPYYKHYNEHTGQHEERLADLHNHNHLMTFDDAYEMYTEKKSPFSGIQFVLDCNKDLEDEDRLLEWILMMFSHQTEILNLRSLR